MPCTRALFDLKRMFGAEVRSPFQRSHSGRLSAALRRSLLEALLDEGGRNTLSAAVHLEKVPTQSEGLVVARDVTTDTLNRLAFNHTLSIGTPAAPSRTLSRFWVA